MATTKALTKFQLLALLENFADDAKFYINPDGEEEFELRRSMFVADDERNAVVIDLTGDPDTEEAEDEAGDEAEIAAAVAHMRAMLG